jgi:hypothetical protein
MHVPDFQHPRPDDDRRPAQGTTTAFGTWLAAISRPGADLSKTLDELRAAPVRRVDFSEA